MSIFTPTPWISKPPLGAKINYGHPLARGLVSAFLFNESGAKSAYDTVDATHTGALTGGATWTPGYKSGSAVTFNGSTGYILGTDIPTIASAVQVTFSGWAKYTSTNSEIANKWRPVGTNRQFDVWTGDGHLQLYVYDSSGNSCTRTASITNNDGKWHHFACVFVGSTSMDIYIDGVLSNGSLTGVSIPSTLANGNEPLRMGAYNASGTLSGQLTGTLDSFYIHNRALSVTEIKQLYATPYCFITSQAKRFTPLPSGYVDSVQNVSITIPTGATSATATISSVGAKAFILNTGFTATGSNTNVSYPRIELTNSTTVTAVRNTSDATFTVTATCVVVDATSNLVNSTQFGTVVLGSGATSATATVIGVNANSSVLHCLGWINAQTTPAMSSMEPLLTISGTTVTATRQFSGSSETVGFVLIEFQPSALNSNVQSYQKTWTNTTTSTTQTITSIDPNKTLLIWAGSNGNATGHENWVEQTAQLTNATTVTLTTDTAGSVACAYNFFVVEFLSGVLGNSVQRGTTTLTAVTSNTSTVSAVSTKAALNFLRYTTSRTVTDITNVVSDVVLTNSTTITSARAGSTGNVTTSWELADFGAGTPTPTSALDPIWFGMTW